MNRYELRHTDTGEIVATIDAEATVDALSRYSLREGFADPRETVLDDSWLGCRAEGDVFYRPNDYTKAHGLWHGGSLGMTFTNYGIEARDLGPVAEDEDVYCYQCECVYEGHASGLCDSCETQEAYERGTEGLAGLVY